MKNERLISMLVAVTVGSACGVHDELTRGVQHAAVSDSDPLPVPADTIVPPDTTNHVAIGSIPATSEVTSDGQAHYRVPIWVSPGRAGMQPDLALEYLSRASNGLVGVGWQLSGFSQITRCPRTFAVDGNNAGPVKYDGQDALCLDNERLIRVSNGSFPYATYSLEHDQFLRATVSAYDTPTKQPIGFTIYEKNGRIRHYSYVGPPASPTTAPFASWLLTQIEDRYGNAINYKYDTQLVTVPNTSNPVVQYYNYPSSIDYTSSNATSTLIANRSVKFTYEPRPDVEMWFNDGNLRLSQRLSTIQIWGPDAQLNTVLLQKYSLTYALQGSSDASITGRSLLTSLTVSDALGNQLGTTNFSWEKGAVGYTALPTSATADVNDEKGFRVVDLNGDGLADLLYLVKDTNDNLVWAARLWDSGLADFGPINTLNLPRTKDSFGNYEFPQPALTDVQTPAGLLLWGTPPGTPPNTTVPIMQELTPFSSGAAVTLGIYNSFSNSADTIFPIDFDGDGLADVIVGWTMAGTQSVFQFSRNNGQYPVTFASPVNLSVPAASGRSKVPGAFAPFRGSDFDGDGRQEIAFCFPDDDHQGPNAPAYIATPEQTIAYLGSGYLNAHEAPLVDCTMLRYFQNTFQVFVDFNGDGLDDSFRKSQYLYDPTNQTYEEIALNQDTRSLAQHMSGLTGARGRVPVTPASVLSANDAIVTPIDDNLDDRPDLFITRPGKPIVVRRYALSDYLISDAFPFATDLFMNDVVSDSNNAAVQVADVNGDGLNDFVIVQSGRYVVYLRNGKKPDMMTNVVDGTGVSTSFVYRPISDSTVYSARLQPSDYSYPLRIVNAGVWVVSSHSRSVGAGGMQQQYFHRYQGASEDVQGRGFLGFDVHQVDWLKSDNTSVSEEQEFDKTRQYNVEPFIGQPVIDTTTVRDANGALIRQTVRRQTLVMERNSDFGTYWTHPSSITMTDYDADANGALQQTYTSTYSISSVDNVGNVLAASLSEGGGQNVSYNWTYQYSFPNWLIAMPVQFIRSGSPRRPCPTCRVIRQTRTVAYQYDARGSLEWEVTEPNIDSSGQITPLPQPQVDGVQTLFTHYLRDTDGQVSTVTRDLDFTPTPQQRSAILYRDGADRVFTTRVVNKLGHMVHVATHPGYGFLAAEQDENGQYSRWQYDTFGRPKRAEPANAEPSSFTYSAYQATGADPSKPSLELHVKGDGGAEHVTQFDLVGQPLHQKRYDRNDGLGVIIDSTYDDSKLLRTRTRSYFENNTAGVADRFLYDAAGRLLRVDYADGRAEQHAFVGAADGLHVDHWDADPSEPTVMHTTSTYDQSALLTSTVQHARAQDGRPARDLAVTYVYGPFDVVSGIRNLGGPAISTSYNRRGEPYYVSDPSFGIHSYAYDAFGGVLTDTIGSEVRSRTYDDLGRIKTLQTRDGTTTWSWDTSPNGVGNIGSITTATGVVTTYGYDWQNRRFDKVQAIGSESYDITSEYDSFGRLSLLQYPAVAGKRYAVRYAYGSRGALQTVGPDGVASALWTRLETDATGAPTNPSGAFPQYSLANGVTVRYQENPNRNGFLSGIVSNNDATTLQSLTYDFDPKGHVKLRRDELRGLQETFDYTELDQLEHWGMSWRGGGQSRVRFDYTDTGNLTARTYELGAGSNATYGYTGDRGGGPYAATTINGQSLSYDGEGNQSAAPGRTATFSTFGLPLSIVQGNITDAFKYDDHNRRAEKTTTISGGATDDTVFVAGLFRRHSTGGTTDYAATVFGPTGPIAYVTIDANGTPTTTSYVLQDYLGTADTIVDGVNGGIVETRKFDPFGNQFDPANPAGPAPAFVSPVPFGFTGHEHDLELGLVNMKGRIYDPSLGRFLSPDPIGLSPLSPLGLNTYAYAGNDPATFNDPTGFIYENGGGDDNGDLPPIGITVGFGGSSDGSGGGVHYANPAPAQSGHQYKQYNAVDTPSQRAQIQTVVRFTRTTSFGDTLRVDPHFEGFRTWADEYDARTSVLGRADAAMSTGMSLLVGELDRESDNILGFVGRAVHAVDPSGAIGFALAVDAQETHIAQVQIMGALLRETEGFLLGAAARVGPTGEAYTVAFETKLAAEDLGRSRSVHFNRANAALDADLQSSPEFAKAMEEQIPGVATAVSKAGGRNNPMGWIWHHAKEEGIMQLVEEAQHTAGSIFWRVMHPDGRGGYSIWAIPRGAPRN